MVCWVCGSREGNISRSRSISCCVRSSKDFGLGIKGSPKASVSREVAEESLPARLLLMDDVRCSTGSKTGEASELDDPDDSSSSLFAISCS